MKVIVCVLMCVCLSMSAHAQSVAFLVVSSDTKISGELLADVTEAIAFQLHDQKKINVIPKERFAALLQYQDAVKHGPCFYDAPDRRLLHACVFQAVQTAGVGKAILFMVEPQAGKHVFNMHVVYADAKRKPRVFTSEYTVDISDIEQWISTAYIFSINAFDVQKTQPFVRIVRNAEKNARRGRRMFEPYIPSSVTSIADNPYMWSAIGTGVGTLAFTAVAIVSGIQARDLETKYQLCVLSPCMPGEAEEYAQEGTRKTLTTNVMIGLAGAFAVGTAALTILAILEEPTESIPSLSITPTVGGAHMMVRMPF